MPICSRFCLSLISSLPVSIAASRVALMGTSQYSSEAAGTGAGASDNGKQMIAGGIC